MKQVQDFKVLNNVKLNAEHFILNIQAPSRLPEILPGQFVNVLVPNSKNIFLRRPLSVHNVDIAENIISLFIKIVGEGTNSLSLLKAGENLNIVYPLGNSFSLPENDKFLLVGGGCGVAPLLFLAKHLSVKGFKPNVLIGAKSKNDIHELDTFRKYANVLLATEDGSLGEKGLVTEHSAFNIQHSAFRKFYACGPEPMLKAVASIAVKNNIDCEVSLENMMACGFGVCLCCVTETKTGNVCVCTEGPVFNIKDLKW